MFERYPEKARRVILFAFKEANEFGTPYIDTEHLLLGLLRADKSLADRILDSRDASIESIRTRLAEGRTTKTSPSNVNTLPLSQESKRVLAYSVEEAEWVGHKQIGTEHLLVGLL